MASTQDTYTNDGDYFPPPPVLHDHLQPSQNPDHVNPSLIAPLNQDNIINNNNTQQQQPLPPSHPQFASQPTPQTRHQQQQQQNQQQQQQQQQLPYGSNPNYHTMPINDPNKTTIAFDMYIPTQSNPQYLQNHPQNCDCCPHHHKRKDGNKILYRHLKQPTWGQYIKDKLYYSWEFIKQTYWHLEPWVFRPLLAGIAYNVGIQLARVSIQTLFPTYFPTTVYLPLRANAKFYDLHARRVQLPVEDNNSMMIHNNMPSIDQNVSVNEKLLLSTDDSKSTTM